MSRLRRGCVLAAAAALALSTLGAAAAARHAGPKYGGTLVVGVASDPGSLDPTVNTQAVTGAEIFLTMCERLYGRNSKLQLVPVLAAALPVLSKDKLTYTVELRQGVRFNDGTPFNAQAVVASIQRMISYPGSTRAGDFDSVESVTASGPYTVVYRLKKRDSTFIGGNPYVLSPTQLAKLGDNFASDPVCVGPFMFDDRLVDDHVTVIKSPYYYDQKDVFLDKIVFKPLRNGAAATAALKAGDIQVLDNVSTTDRDGVEQTSGLRVLNAHQLGWLGLLINIGNRNGVGNLPYGGVDTPLAKSAKLRQALEEAIDRSALNRVVFGGFHQPTCTMIPPANTLWYEVTKVPCTPYDPKDAKRLVAESGLKNPTVHLIVATSQTDRLHLAEFVQAQAVAVGFNVVIDSFDQTTVTARRNAGNFDVYVGGFGAGGVEPVTFQLKTGDVANYSGYSNPRLDLILENGLKATDLKARATLYRVAQQIILNDRPYIALYNQSIFAAYNASVTGVGLTYQGLVTVANARFK